MADPSLVKKLGIKLGQRLLILNAPQNYLTEIELPEGVQLTETAAGDGNFDFVQLFVKDRADVEREALKALVLAKREGSLWFSYPKKSGGVKTDINRDNGWEVVKEKGWRPVTQISIDEVWSALRFKPVELVESRNKTPHL